MLEAVTTKLAMPKFVVNTSSRKHIGNWPATSTFNKAFEASKHHKVETQMQSHEYVERVLIVL